MHAARQLGMTDGLARVEIEVVSEGSQP
jgi:rare lipoprotein A (peptidoglycan hydrolase)